MDKDLTEKIYKRYEDAELKIEYQVLNSMFEVENVEKSVLIEDIDCCYELLLEEIASRFNERVCQPGSVLHLCLNN